jgi:hypothetical protein
MFFLSRFYSLNPQTVLRGDKLLLTGLRLGNFKAFGETQNIPIKPLTLIFGANSAGKSSIIHGLLLACHATETGNLDVHKTRISGDTGTLALVIFRSATLPLQSSCKLTAG